MIVTYPADLKSLVSFLKAFRAHHVILSFEDLLLKIYAADVESVHFLKAEVPIEKTSSPTTTLAVKVNVEDMIEAFNLDKESNPTLEITLLQEELLLEALFTFPEDPHRTIRVHMIYQPVLEAPTWKKISFPLSWTMPQRAFKKNFSNQGQIERSVYVTSTSKQLMLETNKMHRVVCKETFKDPISINLHSEGESQEFLISLDLIKRNLNFPTCKDILISCSKKMIQLQRSIHSTKITIRTTY